ncbi:uncharacterized protein GLRG_02354 [Colletotrichum graminicola M1.001]|uniref:Uncharacterized protein n=1 Tax=Colletotrichum graminicola (strain M1.001 / M2 / FGSC 10212) TaxID=645133 RepID=E3Q8H1_COLGM|nr:uncharacterized protein GLRG_02354 [Colletotrichum graminicola M1.001]EFQ27183.1 hypothetical protein GLRG_02354 [Colletotrichum graminicola M1.001]
MAKTLEKIDNRHRARAGPSAFEAAASPEPGSRPNFLDQPPRDRGQVASDKATS